MRVLAQVVVRNEAERYWPSWLDWHVSVFGKDNIHVFDDNSDDDTAQMAVDAGVKVTAREAGTPAFLEHEGRFRQRAWNEMEQALEPGHGDWVFCIDSDEFLLARGDESDELYRACEWGNHQRRGAYLVSIPEVFRTEVEDSKLVNLQVRVDGWWGKIAGTRLFAWQRGGMFADRVMASGSEPTYVPLAARTSLQNMWLLHYGYARPDDAKAKYLRYTVSPGGHSNVHIQSILSEPQLVPWDGPVVDVYLGARPVAGPEVLVRTDGSTYGLSEVLEEEDL
jgi:hypothetical protein